jgi:PKD repeat protein
MVLKKGEMLHTFPYLYIINQLKLNNMKTIKSLLIFVILFANISLSYSGNHAPTVKDTIISIPLTGLTNADTYNFTFFAGQDIDKDLLNFYIVLNPKFGVLTPSAVGFTYIRKLNYDGIDSFSYRAFDGQLYSNIAWIKIKVGIFTTIQDNGGYVSNCQHTNKSQTLIDPFINLIGVDPSALTNGVIIKIDNYDYTTDSLFAPSLVESGYTIQSIWMPQLKMLSVYAANSNGITPGLVSLFQQVIRTVQYVKKGDNGSPARNIHYILDNGYKTQTGNTTNSYIKNVNIIGSPVNIVADFSANATTGCITSNIKDVFINFTDKSTNTPTSWKWTFQGALPGESTEQNPENIDYSSTGTFNVTLVATNANGSNTTTKSNYIIIRNCTGIESEKPISVLSLYPNPIINNLSIELSDPGKGQIKINLTDIKGRIVKTVINEKNEDFCKNTLDISDLSSGIYFINIQVGEYNTTSKVIKF